MPGLKLGLAKRLRDAARRVMRATSGRALRAARGEAESGHVQKPQSGPRARTETTHRTLQLARGREAFELRYELVRAKRRSIAIQALPDGIRVRAPRWANIADIEQFMRVQQEWIHDHLAACREAPPFVWVEGVTLPILGRAVRLAAAPETTSQTSTTRPRVAPTRQRINLVDDRLEVPRPLFTQALAQEVTRGESGDLFAMSGGVGSPACREAVLKWLHAEAKKYFVARIAAFAERMAVTQPALRLSGARTRWGSCSHGPRGARISLHWKLYLLPPDLIDYVVAHEMAHLSELNHSPRFWAAVERLYPHYREARVELNRLGRALPRL